MDQVFLFTFNGVLIVFKTSNISWFFFLALRWRAVSGLLTNYHALFFALSPTLFRLFHEDRRNN